MQKSTYGNRGTKTSGRSTATASSSAGQMQAGNPDTRPTHSVYTLEKDAEGNVTGKEYINDVIVYEQAGKFGPFLKVIVKGEVPLNTNIFITKKKDA